MADSTPIVVKDRRKIQHRDSKKSGKVVPFAVGLATGVILSQLLGIFLYIGGVIGLTNTTSFGVARLERPSALGLYALEPIFRHEYKSQEVIVALSEVHHAGLQGVTINQHDNDAMRDWLTDYNRKFDILVEAIKKHEPAIARELAKDVQTAAYFR